MIIGEKVSTYMKNIRYLYCLKCKREYLHSPDLTVCECGGLLDVVYDYKYIAKKATKDYFCNCTDYSMWRYRHFLPVKQDGEIEENMRVGFTPLYESKRLADVLGIHKIYIKDDGRNPTGSLKDRASAIGVYKAKESNKNVICCSSTGNAASSLAGNAAAEGVQAVIFVPERAPKGKLAQLIAYGAKVFSVQGNYDETFEMSQKVMDAYEFFNRNAAINPYLLEGKKTVSLEIAEQLNWNITDYVAVSVGDGCTIAGVWKGFKELYEVGLIHKLPVLISVQAKGCSPINDVYNKLNQVSMDESATIADSIAVSRPKNMTKALSALQESNALTVEVDNQEIYEAICCLGSVCGIFAEPSSAISLAGIKKLVESNQLNKDASISLIVTGNGLKDTQAVLSHNCESVKSIKKDQDISYFHDILSQ